MPKPKSPKKTNGVEESVVAASAAIPKTDGIPSEKATSSFVKEDRTTEMNTPTLRKTGRPEIVKTESRSNLVPINLEDEVRRLAYLLSERRGFEPGHETEDWLSAEREVLDRYHQQTA
jgi:hypothetical protein